MNLKSLILILILISLAIPASAEDIYQGCIVMNGMQGVNNEWVSQDMTLFSNSTNTGSFLDVTVKFIRGINEETGYFTVTGTGIESPGVQLTEGADAKKVRDIIVNGTSTKVVKIQLIDIKKIGTTNTTADIVINTTSSSDNPIYAYVYYDRELPMAKGKVNNFNGEDYVKQTGWTTEGGISEVSVYFKRKDTSIPMSITVKAESTEPKATWSDKTAKYLIGSNGKYEFTIKYETRNIWGWKEEFTEVYTLITSGMSSSSSGTKAIVSEAAYEAVVGKEFIVPMSATGTFEKQEGAEITDAGNRKYAFTFDTPGQYAFNFKGNDGGSAVVKFSVKSTSTTPETTTTTTANQQQPPEGDSGSLLWYLILLVAVVGLGYMLLSRKKKSNSYQLHPKAQ